MIEKIYKNKEIKNIFNEQQEHNNLYAKYHFRNTFEIYNYEDELYEVYNPLLINYLKNGNYYETTINDYIKDNQIKIRPIKNTTGYTFGYNPSMIKNNYWVQKDSIEVIEDI